MKGKSALSKVFALLLAVAMMASVFAGCGNSADTTNDTQPQDTGVKSSNTLFDEPVEFTMLYNDNSGWPLNENWLVLQEIKKRTNVTLKMEKVAGSDWDNKRKIVFNSGDIPDIVANCWPVHVSEYAASGVLLPVSDYLDKLPSFKAVVEKNKFQVEIDNYVKEGDGKYYVLPAFTEVPTQDITLVFRKDILEKHQLAEPKSFDELYTLLKKLKELYPDSIPFTNKYGSGMLLTSIARAFGTNAGWSLPFGYTYNWDTKEWYYAPTSENYKTMLKFLGKLVKEGLLDKEFDTQDENQYKQKLLTGKSFGTYFWYSELPSYNQDGKKNTAEYNMAALNPITGPGGNAYVKSQSRLGGGLVIPASVKDKPYFDKLLKFIDWLYYSEEGINLCNWGVENVTYKVENGKKTYASDILVNSNPNGTKDRQKDFGLANYNICNITLADAEAARMSQDEAVYKQHLLDNKLIPMDDPVVPFTADEKAKERLLVTKLNDYINTMTLKFIMNSDLLDTDWDKYVAECDKKGAKELLDLVNNAWKNKK